MTLMLDYFPNANHAGIYAAAGRGHVQAGGPGRDHPPAARPGRADQAGGRRPRRPGHLLRARGAARPRPGPERGRRGRRRAQAADLDHLAAQGQDPLAAGPGGQDRWHRRDRLPGRVPAHDPGPGGRRSVEREDSATWASTWSGRWLAARWTPTLGAFWNYEGVAAPPAEAQTAHHPGRPRRACPPTTSWCWWPTRTRWSATGSRIRAFVGAVARGTNALERDPDKGLQGLLKANPDLTPSSSARGQGHAALVPARQGQAVRLPGPHEWQAFAGWMPDNR